LQVLDLRERDKRHQSPKQPGPGASGLTAHPETEVELSPQTVRQTWVQIPCKAL
jgi:hypothetical protein